MRTGRLGRAQLGFVGNGAGEGSFPMKLRNKILAMTGVALASLGWGTWHGAVVGKAVDVNPQTVLDGGPLGLSVKATTYFNDPKTIGAGQINSAEYFSGSNGDGVALTKDGQTNQGGAIWTDKPVFNAYKDQRASMWVYLGTTGSTPGDGVAFVLQNSSNTAFSGGGESLGVWGVDPNSTSSTTNTLASSAIPNSWALEYDTGVDQLVPNSSWDPKNTPASSFDIGDYKNNNFNGIGYNPSTDNDDVGETITGQHIASNYPGLTSSYYSYSQKIGGLLFGSTYNYYGLAHRGLLQDPAALQFLSDAKWHHLTLNYEAPTDGGSTATITYSFDDKDPATGAPKKMTNDTYAKEKINLANLNVTPSSPNLYWGLTGTTGATNTELSMFKFEQVPGQPMVNSSMDMTDMTTGSAIPAKATISGNDKIKLNYTVNYMDGNQDWSDIKAALNLPKYVDWTGGRVTYSSGEVSPVDMTQLNGQKLDVSLKDLGVTMNKAVLTFEGTAQNAKQSPLAATSTFAGANAITTVATPAFNIKPSPFSVNVNPTEISANAGSATTVTGTVSSTDSTVNGGNTTLTAILADSKGNVATLPASAITLDKDLNGNNGYDFSITIPEVPAGTSLLQVSGTTTASSDYKSSGTATITGGTIDFGSTSGNLVFKPTTLTGNGTQTVERDDSNGAWSLDVDSSLMTGSTWKVTAKTAGMYSDDVPASPLDGALIYKNGTSTTTLNNSESTLITSNDKSDGTEQSTNIASGWTNDTGILLSVNGGAVDGSYSGTIDWTLESAP